MVVAILRAVAGELGAGEKDDRQHENGAGHDHDPRRGLIEPSMLCCKRSRGDVRVRRRLDRGFGCLGHVSIMPSHGPAINQQRRRVLGISSIATSPAL
jgi:hypothetical protein